MSYHWANIIWQSKDGSWNRGYFKRISTANSPSLWENPEEGYDPEWDDEFDDSEFDYLKTGMRSFEDADDYTPAGNPGTHVKLPYKGNSKSCKELDLMAFHHSNPEAKAKHLRSIHNRKRREHFAKLEMKWTLDSLKAANLRVDIKSDDAVYDRTGMTTMVTGYAKVEGQWLTVDGKKVRNMKTGKFHNRVGNVSANRYRRW